MRRPDQTLTAAKIRSELPPGKYFDGNGLYLRVQSSGARQWVQRITIRGRRREIGLGSPPAVTLKDARDLALSHSRLAKSGGDPIAEKRRALAVMTFVEAAETVQKLHLPTWRSEKHGNDFINSLKVYAYPVLGRLRVTEIDTRDVLAALSPLWTAKPETARRVRQRISLILKWSIAQGWRVDNPAENIGQVLPRHDRKKSHRRALPYNEVHGCIETVHRSGAWQGTKLALEFLVLTAARSVEVREARWSELDFGPTGIDGCAAADRSVWTLPAERMKMKREHRIPLPSRAVEVLREAARIRGKHDWVFPSTRDAPLSDMTLSKLVKELGFQVDVHGFRTSFRTWTQERTSTAREVAEAALAHNVGDAVEAAYARSDLFEKRRALMEEWGAYLSTATFSANEAADLSPLRA